MVVFAASGWDAFHQQGAMDRDEGGGMESVMKVKPIRNRSMKQECILKYRVKPKFLQTILPTRMC